jgi:predicted nucleic acid-binding protein
MDTHISDKLSASTRITAFVDTSVFGAYLAGRDAASRLFEDGYPDRVRFAVDPVVLREVLTLPQIQESPELLETVADRLNFEILPLDFDRSQQLLQRAKALRNHIVHSSSILVAASAENCDYLITYDRGIKELIEGDRPRVVTPEEFTSLVASA